MSLLIRKGAAHDIDTLVAFNQAMAQETENKSLNETVLQKGVSQLIATPSMGFYLLAEQNNRIAGSLMVTEEWSDWRAARFWWIQSVYVAPQFRRQGIYSKLYREVQQLAEEQGDVCGLRLYVEKENTTAQKTYQALGMEENQYLMYETK
ncbi:GNAT family N-acetyltransferase [Halioxenophilus aromaticivorans]|uniref:GNAT family N-acetyltransferase n=1 Tax=Halioxenophilus aromaticivorans TaxID=1306992 RepID=A0AAV3U1R7_9ALTE